MILAIFVLLLCCWILILYLLSSSDKLEWKDRIKVALEIARLLEFLHGKEPQCVVSNLSPAHIAIDQVSFYIFDSSHMAFHSSDVPLHFYCSF